MKLIYKTVKFIEFIILSIHVIICFIVSEATKTIHMSFWWMLFFGVPFGLIITLLLDLNTPNELKLDDEGLMLPTNYGNENKF